MVKVRGTGGPPSVVVTGPKGERVEGGRVYDPRFVVFPLPAESATVVALRAPSAGQWTVSAAPGSPPIASVATALGRARPHVRVTVRRTGRRRVLDYAVTGGEGWRITLAEQGARTFHVLGRATGTRGAIAFASAPGRRERRRIVARIEADGVPATSLAVGSYRAPGDARLGRPGGVRVRHRGTALSVRWRGVAGAVRYAVTVVPARGERLVRTTRARRIALRGVPAGSVQVLVRAIDGGGIAGPAARVRVPR
jgi:hypothetical protein